MSINKMTKERSRRYPAQTITDTDYADDIALLANTLAKAKSLLHSLERAAAGIGLHVNAHKTEYMCFNQRGDISSLDGSSLKRVDKFTYRDRHQHATSKSMAGIDWLSVIWKSDLTNKIKRSFFQAAVMSIVLYGCKAAAVWPPTTHYENYQS